jgi:hypothetical protein
MMRLLHLRCGLFMRHSVGVHCSTQAVTVTRQSSQKGMGDTQCRSTSAKSPGRHTEANSRLNQQDTSLYGSELLRWRNSYQLTLTVTADASTNHPSTSVRNSSLMRTDTVLVMSAFCHAPSARGEQCTPVSTSDSPYSP